MSRIPRKAGEPRATEGKFRKLTFFERSNLLYGTFEHFCKWTPEEKKASWQINRATLLEDWFKDEDHLGSRPEGFWKFDYPGVLEQFADEHHFVTEQDELKALRMIDEATPEEIQKLESEDFKENHGRPVP